ncbi:MAG: bifunctional (p)ppGpp synthetase/guanosine-3',5'-bis(diphosphate) 3'-pyrophosphohydrolase [Desulfobacterota bacterium]|nr:bifunctional (p)ppGpp synthetase/guanosine-3',5'-bis(diphosphate) 3'-pyrophosphohydrolase [Thermodesulfobacteriota bacterium]MDW8001502.1 bifunctional (p)ppGpp synthetase/guanosine-3',5'-bis(diphosphate) 3'-pyrophosphohydrolase [Deltaproteobacteria bacterium]
MVRFNDILEEVQKYNPNADFELLKKAYVFSAQAHRGKLRLSGEPYLVHPLAVAYILAKMNLDIPSIVSGLLHDTIEDTHVKKEDIEQHFGSEIASLVDGVTKISRIDVKPHEDTKAETLRKMIVAMGKDIRVILIKLADRYHNMQTLNFMPWQKQVEIAKETLEIYAPLAHRLGIEWLKGELEDLAFKYLYPKEYKSITDRLKRTRKETEAYINEVVTAVKEKFHEYKLEAEIQGRVKRVYSIYRKMKQENKDLEDIYDLIAFRVIVDTVKECYLALGIIHSFFKPIPGKFTDYIAMPKSNMYQSLHTKVIGLHGEKIEFQIRTKEMHKIAEEGIAAHWKYKEGKVFDPKEEKIFSWLRRMIESISELKDGKEIMEAVAEDLFPEEIYVFTPKGDVKELPRDSTPIDFAYAIHTELGHHCVGAKVNGRLVPLKYKLKSGDTVEIITSPSQTPSKDWLAFVKTSRAKTKIRQFLKAKQREQSIELGKSLLEKECLRKNLSLSKIIKSGELKNVAKEFGFEEVDDLFASIGYGLYTPLQVLGRLLPESEKQTSPAKVAKEKNKVREAPIRVKGVDGLVVRFARCCSPIPGDKIFGFITRGRGLTIHTEDCPNCHSYDEQRKIDVIWDSEEGKTYPVKLRIYGIDRKGLLSDISTAISTNKVNILNAHAMSYPDKTAVGIYEVEIENLSQLNRMIKSILRIKGVKSVERLRH